MAGTDCGFAQSPFAQRVHPTIMWAKLRSLAEGARLATQELWGAAFGSMRLAGNHVRGRHARERSEP
jgi:hypothetical protein